MGAGRGALVAQLGGPVRGGAVRGGAVRVEVGLAEGFGVPFCGVVGRWDVDRVGLGAAVAVGAGLVAVAVAVALGAGGLGPGCVGDGSGAGLVALSEGSGPGGSGVAFGGCGFPVAVALDVGEEVAPADDAGGFGAEVADGFVLPGGAGAGAVFLGGAWVAFLVSGGAFVGAVFFRGASVALLVSGDA
ncbi:hypothetical protein [Streptosporangium sp. H16]|uniref:hypothetical protein n=1 Tax=Streptosporangium sp. H16 TaxID=3444184 RepID=UPI003F7AD205